MENLPAPLESKSMFFDVELFDHAQRVAKVFAASTMVPEQFRNNLGNCLIAMNYANRIKADMFMCMQTMHVIHGKPGVEGKLVAALINQSGKYREPLKYQWLDPKDNEIDSHLVINDDTKDYRGCRAYTIDAKSGKEVYGPKISWHTVHAEGWFNKSGSKWKTIPEIMFMYRAASWFANVHCPEVKLGMQTVEELKDIVELRPAINGTYSSAADITRAIQENAETTDNQEQDETPEFKCDICGYEAASERGMKTHMTRSHGGESKTEWPDEDELKAEAEAAAKAKAQELEEKVGNGNPDPIDTMKDGGYKCLICGDGGMTEDEYAVHQCIPGSGGTGSPDQTQKLVKDLARRVRDFDKEVKDEAFKQMGLQGSADLERYDIKTLDELVDRCYIVQTELKM